MPTNHEKIKEATQEFFSKAGFSVDAIEIKNIQDSAVSIGFKTDDPQILIGDGGQTLADVQRLLKLVLQKKIEHELPFYIDLDINAYKKKKTEYLKEMAKSAADEVVLTKKDYLLPPMSAYDRRIIHIELASRTDIVAESVGQDPERKIVVKLHL